MTIPTSAETKHNVHVLNACIETCIDGEKGYALAAADVREPKLKSLFEQFENQRAGFAVALRYAIEDMGGRAEQAGSAKGALHRGLTNVRVAMEGHKDFLILGECERGELAALEAYDRVINDPSFDTLPAQTRALVIEQRGGIKTAHDVLTSEDIRRRAHPGATN